MNVDAFSVGVSSSGINGISASGADATAANKAGGNGGTVNISSTHLPGMGSVTISSPITATTGKNGSNVTTGGNGGTVNVTSNGTVTVNSTVKVSDSATPRASKNEIGRAHV